MICEHVKDTVYVERFVDKIAVLIDYRRMAECALFDGEPLLMRRFRQGIAGRRVAVARTALCLVGAVPDGARVVAVGKVPVAIHVLTCLGGGIVRRRTRCAKRLRIGEGAGKREDRPVLRGRLPAFLRNIFWPNRTPWAVRHIAENDILLAQNLFLYTASYGIIQKRS